MNNSIDHNLKPKLKPLTRFASNIYTLICSDCGGAYVIQTGGNFSKRCTQHH